MIRPLHIAKERSCHILVRMNSTLLMKRWIWTIIGLAIAAALLVFVKYNPERKPLLKIDTYTVAPTELPTLIPADMPIEKDVPILENYAAIVVDGRLQSTRTYESSQGIDESFAQYQEYFKSHGWTISASKSLDNYRAIFAGNGPLSAQAVMTQDAAGKKKVQITVMSLQSKVTSSSL